MTVRQLSRKGWGLLLVVGLVAGLLSVGADRATAEPGEPDNLAVFSACVGQAIRSVGFQDTRNSFAEDDINCIGYYGVTRGRTATRYSPAENVTRWQMALFLARAAGPAGVQLSATPRDQGFTDIDGLSAEARNAANALAAADIMPGTTTTFSPNLAVTRRSMAMLLDAFLDAAAIGEGGTDPDDVRPDDEVFTDIGEVTVSEFNAIRRIYELGITRGVTANRYGPDQLITREQMAAFIGRMLAHTQTRPIGLTLQTNSETTSDVVELLVSVRDSDFWPVVDAEVDVFSSTDPRDAFTSSGACASDVEAVTGDACRIDHNDDLTGVTGEVVLDVSVLDTTTFWAWTGDVGDVFDSDTTEAESIEVGFVEPATQFIVSDNLREGATKLQFGDTLEVTLQLADMNGRDVREAGEEVQIREMLVEKNNERTQDRPYETNSAGQIRLTYTLHDPARGTDDGDAMLTLTFTAGLSITDERTVEGDVYAWSDDDPEATQLVLRLASTNRPASNGARNTVSATLTDQYGNGIRGETITFTSDNENGLYTTGMTGTTRSNGRASIQYTWGAATGATEMISASHTDADTSETITAESVDHYWTVDPPTLPHTGALLDYNLSRNQLVVESANGPVLYLYDGNDQHNYDGAGISLARFEELLDEDRVDMVEVTSYNQRSSDVSRFTLQTSSSSS